MPRSLSTENNMIALSGAQVTSIKEILDDSHFWQMAHYEIEDLIERILEVVLPKENEHAVKPK